MSDIDDNDSRQASPAPEDEVQAAGANDGDMSDRDSDILSEVGDIDLEEYDPLKANIEQRPVDIDEDVAKSLKATKRKRAEGDAAAAKRPKEGRRPKKRRTEDGDEVSAADGTIIEGKRRRAGASSGGGEKKAKSRSSKRPSPEPENDEHLTPEQRRARAIERAMDAAVKGKSNKRRTKKDEVVCVHMAHKSHHTGFVVVSGESHANNTPRRTWKKSSTTSSQTSRSRWRRLAGRTTWRARTTGPPWPRSSCCPR